MASNKRTIYLGLDYYNFTGGVSEVNRKMTLLDAEFKKAQEEAKLYGNETDSLGLKHDMLTQKIKLQMQKVVEAQENYDKAVEKSRTTGEVSQKTLDATKKALLNEENALLKLQNQLKDTEDAQDDLNNKTESFGDAIRSVGETIGLQTNPILEKLASRFDGVSKEVGYAIVGVGAIVSKFVSLSVESARAADDLLTLASTTGLTTDELQKLEYASKFVDVSVDTMSSSITKLTSNMNKARNGSKDMQEAFNKLHIKVTDSNGALKDSNEIFYEAIDRLGKVRNETERDALAMTLFGKSAKELNPLIEAGSKRLKELGIEAENMGVIMSGDDLEALGRLNDAMDKFESTTDALKNSLGLVLLPILTSLFEAISKIPAPVLQTLVVLASVVATIVLVVKAIKSVTDTASNIKKMFSLVDGGMLKTTAIIMGVVAALVALGAIIAVLMGKKDDLNSTLSGINSSVSGMQKTVTGAQNTTYSVSNNASGTTNFRGGQTWVGEAGPELVTLPGGTQITPATQSSVNYWNVTIDAKNVSDFNRVVEMAQAQRMAVRRV